MKIFAETERLILREILPADDAGMFELDSDPEVHRYLGNKPVQNIEQSREIIAYVRRQYIDYGIGRWAMIEKNTSDFIGWSGLKLNTDTLNNYTNFHDVGYRLIKRYWGKGYATESALAALNYGFTTLNLPVIYGIAEVQNTASNNTLCKIGLSFVETFDYDSILYNWYETTRPEI